MVKTPSGWIAVRAPIRSARWELTMQKYSEIRANSHLLNEKQVAHMAGISTSWLQKLRMLGEGPRFYKLGKAVRYSEVDVQRWIESLRAA